MKTSTIVIIISSLTFFIFSIFFFSKKNRKNKSSNLEKQTNSIVQKTTDLTTPKSPPLNKPIAKKENETIYTYVAGIPHKLGKQVNIESILKVDQALRAQRDKNNPHDSNAIALHTNNLNIGFIPKAINTNIAMHLDSGKLITIYITSIDKNDLWKGILIKVELI
jgi:hypothetical protein